MGLFLEDCLSILAGFVVGEQNHEVQQGRTTGGEDLLRRWCSRCRRSAGARDSAYNFQFLRLFTYFFAREKDG